MSTRPQLTPIDPQAGRYRTPRYSSRGGAEQMAQVARSLSGLSQTLRSSYATQQASTGQTEMQKFMDRSEALYNLSPEKWQEKLETLQEQARKEQNKKVPIFKKLLKTGVVESPWELAAFQNGAYVARAKNFAKKFYGQALTSNQLSRLQENPQQTLEELKKGLTKSDEYDSIISNQYGAYAMNELLSKYDSEYLEKQQEFRKKHETDKAVDAVVGTSFDILTSPNFLSENRINEIKNIVNDVVFIAEGSEREFIEKGLIPALQKLSSDGKREQAEEILEQVYYLNLNNRGAKFTSAFEEGELTEISESLEKIEGLELKREQQIIESVLYRSGGEDSVLGILDNLVETGEISDNAYIDFITGTDFSKFENLFKQRNTQPVDKASVMNTMTRDEFPIDDATYQKIISGNSNLSATEATAVRVYQTGKIAHEEFQKIPAYKEAIQTIEQALKPLVVSNFVFTFGESPRSYWEIDNDFKALRLKDQFNLGVQQRIENEVKADFRAIVKTQHLKIVDAWYKGKIELDGEEVPFGNAEYSSAIEQLKGSFLKFDPNKAAEKYVAKYCDELINSNSLNVGEIGRAKTFRDKHLPKPEKDTKQQEK